ncbi:MAG: glycosyltransferase family 4 protein [Bacteriovoracaceae bacterium]|nr:glycosyltransferase family 4 protein [Bacteriovoracaceae bacterium]
MRFVIYSGSYSINSLGATKSLCTKLVKEIRDLGYGVTWVGRGHLEDSEGVELFSLSKSKVSELIIRLKNKALRTFFGYKPNDISINEFLKYDRLVAAKLESGEIHVNEDTCFIGLGGMSLFSFQAVKRKGGKTILASQFFHPHAHSKLLDKEYEKLGASNPIPEGRIKRQLEEIDEVDLIWVFSDIALDSFLENGVTKNRLINSQLGVDFKLYNSGALTSRGSQEHFNILFVGNVNPEKGVHILLDAILLLGSRKKNINLILNGNVAPYFKENFDKLKNKLMRKGIAVSVEPGDPFNNYMKSDLFILPSVHDSFGLVVLEAMASGLPVIVSSQVGAKDCVKAEENGFIFKESDSKELADYIAKFLENDELCDNFSRKSLELAHNYDWNKVIKILVEKLLEKLP